MKQEETRERLIESTIRVIARHGLDNATTKMIGSEVGINEVYIYRCFKDKIDMFAKTFQSLDLELVSAITDNLPLLARNDLTLKERCRLLYSKLWAFLLGNEDKCKTYVRYFYSPYFKLYSEEQHKANYAYIVEKFKPAFRERANVWMLLNHIFNVLLDFAIKVYNDALPNDDDTEEHVFRLIYASVSQYFIGNEEA
ncbi:MAG: TetR/AcrR family transcriptional regulator [Clostridia bacterium]|nr:TetR/AcrR family transcriptional regulator [Clostridia bacterium]